MKTNPGKSRWAARRAGELERQAAEPTGVTTVEQVLALLPQASEFGWPEG